MDETSQGVVSLETVQQQIVVKVVVEVEGRKVRWQWGDSWRSTHTVAEDIPANN